MNARELRGKRAELITAAQKLAESAEKEERDFSPEEQTVYDNYLAEAEKLLARAERFEKVQGLSGGLRDALSNNQAPAHNQIPLGDSETRAWAHWIKTGDDGGIRELRGSNDTTMNITTAADGGYAVPTGHYQGIIARRDESLLANKLGVRRIPGKGTTVNVPVDNEADGEFVATTESNAFDRDAPAIAQVAMTLVMYTKKVDLTYQLLEDEDARIMEFLDDFVGRGMAKTHNDLLLTEVAANGTSLKTFASATVIADGEPETIVYNDDLAPYLDDTRSCAWVMRRSVHGEIAVLGSTSTRHYAADQQGSRSMLLDFPVVYSYKSGATAASTKSVYFGNWNFVGLREAPGFNVVRDPYTRSSYGEVILNYMFRCDYGVLIAEAIGFGVHPSA